MHTDDSDRPPPKVLICGSRNWPQHRDEATERVHEIVRNLPRGTIIIEGEANGVDTWARRAAVERALYVIEVPARPQHWTRFGKRAGMTRNLIMLDLLRPEAGDYVIAVQIDGSHGTQATIRSAQQRGLRVELHTFGA